MTDEDDEAFTEKQVRGEQSRDEIYTGVMDDLLDDAEELLTSRNGSHGDPMENHRHIANLWSAYLDVPISPRNVADMCILLKLSRGKVGGASYDHYADTIGYALIAADIGHREQGLIGYGTKPDPEEVPDPEGDNE